MLYIQAKAGYPVTYLECMDISNRVLGAHKVSQDFEIFIDPSLYVLDSQCGELL